MGRGGGAFKSEKRKKELMRQKKQEKKRQRRFEKDAAAQGTDEGTPLTETEKESGSQSQEG